MSKECLDRTSGQLTVGKRSVPGTLRFFLRRPRPRERSGRRAIETRAGRERAAAHRVGIHPTEKEFHP